MTVFIILTTLCVPLIISLPLELIIGVLLLVHHRARVFLFFYSNSNHD